MSKEPMIKLQPGGEAPILSCNVPEGRLGWRQAWEAWAARG